MKNIPETKSGSSAKWMKDQSVPDYGHSADRISTVGKEGALGDRPIRVGSEVKYKQYANDQRMTTDFATGPDNGDRTAGFDGATTMMPAAAPDRTFINTGETGK